MRYFTFAFALCTHVQTEFYNVSHMKGAEKDVNTAFLSVAKILGLNRKM